MPNNKNVKILIIEDEEELADVLETKIKKQGYKVFVMNDGEEGYNKIISWKPDLILLDIVMPKMDGYEVLEKMQEDKIEIPVIIISNSGQPVEIEKTKKLGAVDHLIKTQFEPDEVIEKVNNYLNGVKKINNVKEVEIREDAKVNKLNVKVLLVEDDLFLREICAKKLAKEGFSVFEAIDGEEALKILEKNIPDVVLLDIILPAINGFDVLKKIRSNKNSKISKVPVIMLSNLGQEDDVKKAMDLGASNYLVKAHFTTDEITEKIKKELKI